MKNIILVATLSLLSAPCFAQVKPCVWPNKCEKPRIVAQVKPCVWPNKCAKPRFVAQVKPCVWPNKCAKSVILS